MSDKSINTVKKKGFAIILNHKGFDDPKRFSERLGTEKDVENLTSMLPSLQYECSVHNNLTYEEIMNLCDDFTCEGSQFLKNYDSLLVVILSHGELNRQVAARDRVYDLNELIYKFHPTNCPHLVDKPKIFIVSTCRGYTPPVSEMVNTNLMSDSKQTEVEPMSTNLYSNVAIIHGTNEKETSSRCPNNGTYLIQEVALTLTNFERDRSVQQMEINEFFAIMNHNLIKREISTNFGPTRQMAQIINSLEKKFYFTK